MQSSEDMIERFVRAEGRTDAPRLFDADGRTVADAAEACEFILAKRLRAGQVLSVRLAIGRLAEFGLARA